MTRHTFSSKWIMAASLAVAGLIIPASAQTTGQESQSNQSENQNSQWNQDQNSQQDQGQYSQQNQPYQQEQWGQQGLGEGQNAPAFEYRQQRFTNQGQPGWQQNYGEHGQNFGENGQNSGESGRRFNHQSNGQSYEPGSSQGYDHSGQSEQGNWNQNQQGQSGWSNESGYGRREMNRGLENEFSRENGQPNWQGQQGWSNQSDYGQGQMNEGRQNWQGRQGDGRTIVLAVGRIVGTHRFQLQGENSAHEFAVLQSRNGQNVIVDLGPRSNLHNVSLSSGTKLACVGSPERVDGRPVLEATIVSDITEVPQNRQQPQQAGMHMHANRPSQFQSWIDQQDQQQQQSSFSNQEQSYQNGSQDQNGSQSQNELQNSDGSGGSQAEID